MVLALLCILPIETLAQTAATDQNPPPPLGKLVDVRGYRIHLYCSGTGGPTVVVVAAGYSFDWGLVQPEVAKFTQVCSYDHSGIGFVIIDRPEVVIDAIGQVVQSVRKSAKL